MSGPCPAVAEANRERARLRHLLTPPADSKLCVACHECKSLDQFGTRPNRTYKQPRSHCRNCESQEALRWRKGSGRAVYLEWKRKQPSYWNPTAEAMAAAYLAFGLDEYGN